MNKLKANMILLMENLIIIARIFMRSKKLPRFIKLVNYCLSLGHTCKITPSVSFKSKFIT